MIARARELLWRVRGAARAVLRYLGFMRQARLVDIRIRAVNRTGEAFERLRDAMESAKIATDRNVVLDPDATDWPREPLSRLYRWRKRRLIERPDHPGCYSVVYTVPESPGSALLGVDLARDDVMFIEERHVAWDELAISEAELALLDANLRLGRAMTLEARRRLHLAPFDDPVVRNLDALYRGVRNTDTA